MPEASLLGHMHSGEGEHGSSEAVEGSPNVFIGGVPVLRVGDHFADNSEVTEGAPHVFINGRRAARMGDAVSNGATLAQGCPRVRIGNCGGAEYGRKKLFAALTDPKDKLILCMPEIAAAEAERANATNRQGWIYLYEMLLKWRNKPAYAVDDSAGQGIYDNGGQEPYMVEWSWLMEYARFRDAVQGLTQREEGVPPFLYHDEYLFSSAACDKLTNILSVGEVLQTGGSFDHSSLSWDKWRRHAFQGMPMSFLKIGAIAPGLSIKPDGLQAVLAETTVYALAAGEVRIIGNKRRIIVRRVYAFIHDGFEFSGEQWLGNWRCDETYKGFDLSGGTSLRNSDYRNFRSHTTFGCDFRTICTPHIVWEGEFGYDAP